MYCTNESLRVPLSLAIELAGELVADSSIGTCMHDNEVGHMERVLTY